MAAREKSFVPKKAIGLGFLPLTVAALFFALTWDTQRPPQTLIEFLLQSNSDCTAPCWQGIRPGVTTRQEIDEVVTADPERFAQLKIHDPKGWARYIWVDTSSPFSTTILLDFQSAILKSVHFYPVGWPVTVQDCWICTDENYQISFEFNNANAFNLGTMSEFVQAAGSPDRYYAEIFRSHGGMGSNLALIYEEGFLIEGPVGDYDSLPIDQKVELTPALPVVSVLFYDSQGVLKPGSYHETWPWTGFGVPDQIVLAVE